jgi:hypothetical protein
MHKPMITPLLLAVALLACGAADKETAADKPKDGGKPKVTEKAKGRIDKGKDDKAKDDKEKSKNDEKPACMHCGATCGLAPICVCEPGTKKQPKVEFDVQCEPICVAGCSTRPWPFGRCEKHISCTACCEEPCRCPGWVRNCKKLKKETTDEEVPTIKRKVAYLCDCCAGRCTAGCCEATPHPRPTSWWTRLAWW